MSTEMNMQSFETHIAYTRNDRQGSTSFSQTLREKEVPCSVISLDADEVEAFMPMMSKLECNQIIEPFYHISANEVLVERFGIGFDTWLDCEYKRWTEDGQRTPWLDFIEKSFTSVFGDLFLAFRKIYREKMWSGGKGLKLLISIYVGEGDVRAKLNRASPQTIEDQSTMLFKDTTELSELMAEALIKGSSDEKMPQHVSKALWDLLDVMKDEGVISEVRNPDWLFDEPLFWTSPQKSTFIRKLWYRIKHSENRKGFEGVNGYLDNKVKNWKETIHTVRGIQIKKEMIAKHRAYVRGKKILEKNHESLSGSVEDKDEDENDELLCGFGGAAGFNRHWNDHYQQKDKKATRSDNITPSEKVANFVERIDENGRLVALADKTIGDVGSLCSHLHLALMLYHDRMLNEDGQQELGKTMEDLSSNIKF